MLSRILALFRSRRAESHERREALEALHLRQLDLLQRVRIEATQALTARRQLEATIAQHVATADERETAARVAAGVESDDHVRELLRAELEARRRAEDLTPILERLQAQERILAGAVEDLAMRVDAFAARKSTLLARSRAAHATEELARGARHLRDQTTAVDDAIEAAHGAVSELGQPRP